MKEIEKLEVTKYGVIVNKTFDWQKVARLKVTKPIIVKNDPAIIQRIGAKLKPYLYHELEVYGYVTGDVLDVNGEQYVAVHFYLDIDRISSVGIGM